MQGEKIVVTLNKIGKTELEEPLKDEILIPIADKPDAESWNKIFSKWPAKPGVMEKVSLHDAVVEGLRTLARRQKVKAMIDEYKTEHPSGSSRRGRGTPKEIVTL